jgi:hypothetical protein
MDQLEVKQQIEQLQREYSDLRMLLGSLSKDISNTAHLRGALAGAGAAAELILKCVYRKEKAQDAKIPKDKAYEMNRQESEKLMLDELIRNVESKLPLRITTHLRTIQAWRNIGSHSKGKIDDTINDGTLQVVSVALNELVIWFVGDYLNGDLTHFVENGVSKKSIDAEGLNQWRESYWFAMKDGTLSKTEQSQLDFLQSKSNITNEDRDEIINSYNRNLDDFQELTTEILVQAKLTDIDCEHIDFNRLNCCISEKEASEVVKQLLNGPIGFPAEIKFKWMKDAFRFKNNETKPITTQQAESVFPPQPKIAVESARVESAPNFTADNSHYGNVASSKNRIIYFSLIPIVVVACYFIFQSEGNPALNNTEMPSTPANSIVESKSERASKEMAPVNGVKTDVGTGAPIPLTTVDEAKAIISQYYSDNSNGTLNAKAYFDAEVDNFISKTKISPAEIQALIDNNKEFLEKSAVLDAQSFRYSRSTNGVDYFDYWVFFSCYRASKKKIQECNINVEVGLTSNGKIKSYIEKSVTNLVFKEP